jgi:hypothetical protein
VKCGVRTISSGTPKRWNSQGHIRRTAGWREQGEAQQIGCDDDQRLPNVPLPRRADSRDAPSAAYCTSAPKLVHQLERVTATITSIPTEQRVFDHFQWFGDDSFQNQEDSDFLRRDTGSWLPQPLASS